LPRLVQITDDPATCDLRLRRLLRGKARPFRAADVLRNLLPAGWKAEPTSLRGGKREAQNRPERRSLSAQRGGGAAFQTSLGT